MAIFPSIAGIFIVHLKGNKKLILSGGRCRSVFQSMITVLAVIFGGNSMAQSVDVKLHHIGDTDTILISPTQNSYALVSESDTLVKLSTNEVIRLTLKNEQIRVKSLLSGLDTALSTLALTSEEGRFELKRNGRREEHFNGTVYLSKDGKGRLQLINRVRIDSYVSRVLIEEVGYNVPDEYLKIQAIISRTYAVRTKGRHADDGYDLCNSVHCQVYDGKQQVPSNIHQATASTSGTVITDTEGKPILAAFHANCGGKTANSEHVWNSPLPYLTSTVDTFCLSQRSATWSKTVDLSLLKKYVHNQTGLNVDSLNWDSLELNAERSGKTIEIFGETLSLPMMRRDLRLKSTYFEMKIEDGKAVFNGKGFGHGVGLCQQGAINMARQKFNHRQILGHYFKGTRLEPISASILPR